MAEKVTVPTGEARRQFDRRLVESNKRPQWRTEAQRDHDRILYCSAFQRLGGITQVSAPELGRPFHTRLTHTLKVAQVARRSAERLKKRMERGHFTGPAKELVECLDVDAVESAALAHDLGHPPFGHVAEAVLNAKVAKAGGFEGNPQSFRIVTRLALRSSEPGLDLTRRTLNGLLKYPWLRNEEDPKRKKKWGAYKSDEKAFDEVRKYSIGDQRSLEAQIMDWADDITYAVHDLDDFYRAGLIPLDRLAHDPGELDRFGERLREEWDPGDRNVSADDLIESLEQALKLVDLEGMYDGRPGQRIALRSFGSMLITRYMEAFDIRPLPQSDKAEVVISDAERNQVDVLKQLTMLYVVKRPSLAVIQHGQAQMIAELWDWYMTATTKDPRLLPPAYQARLEEDGSEEGRARLVTDLIAGLTEPTAHELFARMSGHADNPALDAAALM